MTFFDSVMSSVSQHHWCHLFCISVVQVLCDTGNIHVDWFMFHLVWTWEGPTVSLALLHCSFSYFPWLCGIPHSQSHVLSIIWRSIRGLIFSPHFVIGVFKHFICDLIVILCSCFIAMVHRMKFQFTLSGGICVHGQIGYICHLLFFCHFALTFNPYWLSLE